MQMRRPVALDATGGGAAVAVSLVAIIALLLQLHVRDAVATHHALQRCHAIQARGGGGDEAHAPKPAAVQNARGL